MEKTEKKKFDLGIYTYKPTVRGLICPTDERKMKAGEIVIVLHPIRKVDPRGLYCYGVTTQGTLSMMKRNIKLNRVQTMEYDRPLFSTYVQETHLMLNKAQELVNELSSPKQLTL